MSIYNNTILTELKPTWLMVKQHNITGLKYFCKTTKKNPHRYKGSGHYWTRHLAKHGSDITTTWCELFTDKESLVEFALFFSEEFNIVQSSDWANLKAENGLDGGSDAGRKHSAETKEKISHANKGRSTWNKGLEGAYFHSPETLAKMAISQQGELNGMYGKHHSDETKVKLSEAGKGRKVAEDVLYKWCKPKSEETKAKMRKPKSIESIRKRQATYAARRLAKLLSKK